MPAYLRFLSYIVLCILLTGCGQITSTDRSKSTPLPTTTAVMASPTVAIPGYQPLPANAQKATIFTSPDSQYFIASSPTPTLATLFDQQGKALGSYTLNQIGAMPVRWFPDSSGAILWYDDTTPYPNAVLMDNHGHVHQLPFNTIDAEISNDSQWIAITRENTQYQSYVTLVKRSDLSMTYFGLGQTLGWVGTSLLLLKGTNVYVTSIDNVQHLLGNVNWVDAITAYQSNESPDGQVVSIQTQHGIYFATNTSLINLNYIPYTISTCGSYAVNGMTDFPWISSHALLGVDAQGNLTSIDIISDKVTPFPKQMPVLYSLITGQCMVNSQFIYYFNATSNSHFVIANIATGVQHDLGLLPLDFWHLYWFGSQRLLMQGTDGSLAILNVSH